MRLGATSPEGYFQDSHQLSVIADELLVPFRNGAAQVLIGAFDEPTDRELRLTTTVPAEAVLVFDGLFIHRAELLESWDLSVMLRADRRCDDAWLGYLETDLPTDPTARATELDRRLARARWPRYRAGWQRYLDSIGPTTPTVTINNEDVSTPSIMTAKNPA